MILAAVIHRARECVLFEAIGIELTAAEFYDRSPLTRSR
jgi:hypothetical protein